MVHPPHGTARSRTEFGLAVAAQDRRLQAGPVVVQGPEVQFLPGPSPSPDPAFLVGRYPEPLGYGVQRHQVHVGGDVRSSVRRLVQGDGATGDDSHHVNDLFPGLPAVPGAPDPDGVGSGAPLAPGRKEQVAVGVADQAGLGRSVGAGHRNVRDGTPGAVGPLPAQDAGSTGDRFAGPRHPRGVHAHQQVLAVGDGVGEAAVADVPAGNQFRRKNPLLAGHPELAVVVAELEDLHDLVTFGVLVHASPMGALGVARVPRQAGVDPETGPGVGVERTVRVLGSQGNESAPHGVLDHDGGLVGRIGVGIGLLVVSAHGHGRGGRRTAEVVEEDHVVAHLVVVAAAGRRHDAVADPDVDEGGGHAGSHLERKDEAVAPALALGNVGGHRQVRLSPSHAQDPVAGRAGPRWALLSRRAAGEGSQRSASQEQGQSLLKLSAVISSVHALLPCRVWNFAPSLLRCQRAPP